eukprot:c12011_g1_i1.p1 GENE.c12011_g1_i1~~c12011_g1_i1.p1  ORF type:complete len:337 (+),score=110.64 c12011_g1_i1:41-1051(+)
MMLLGIVGNATQSAQSVVTDLDLDNLLNTSKNEIPKPIEDRLREIERNGGINELKSLLERVCAQAQVNRAICKELSTTLDSEERSDRDFRIQYPQSSRIVESSKINSQLKQQIHTLSNQLEGACVTNKTVETKIITHERALQFVSQGSTKILSLCPQLGKAALSNEEQYAFNIIIETRANLDNILKARETTKNYISDYISKNVSDVERAKYTDLQLLERALQLHNSLIREIQESIQKQENCIKILLDNTPKLKSGYGRLVTERQEFLKAVETGVKAFQDIFDTLRNGSVWHQQFQETLISQLERVKQFDKTRKAEKQMFIESLTSPSARVVRALVP